MKRIILEENRKKSNKMRIIIAGLGIFLVVLFLEVWVVNRNSTYGDKIYQIKQAQASLELENQVLANTIASKSSMSILEKKANTIGFNSITHIEYIKFSGTLASAQ